MYSYSETNKQTLFSLLLVIFQVWFYFLELKKKYNDFGHITSQLNVKSTLDSLKKSRKFNILIYRYLVFTLLRYSDSILSSKLPPFILCFILFSTYSRHSISIIIFIMKSLELSNII